jgi:murein L,D-transpeptidase YafK
MHRYQRFLKYLFLLLALVFCLPAAEEALCQGDPGEEKIEKILASVTPGLEQQLAARDLGFGDPVFIRIFKLQRRLEVWLRDGGRYRLFKSYPICSYSGYLGPKLREGDWQSPEGFYRVTPAQMNPRSSYHLSFDIGYPNEYDAMLDRDGGNIMVHGGCSSSGCFAMSNHRMEEIYALAHAAFAKGQTAIAVHIFPFPLTERNLQRFRFSPWIDFWKNLQPGYATFERHRMVPAVTSEKGRYLVAKPGRLAMSPGQ